MFNSEWTWEKKNKLIDLYKQAPILWARKGLKVHPRQRSNALQKIADEIGHNVLEIEKKLHVLRSQFMRERKRMLKSWQEGGGDIETYQSHWQYYKRLEFLAGVLEPTNNTPSVVNPNASEGENSNQSLSNGQGEFGDGADDFENQSALTVPVQKEGLNQSSLALPSDVSSNLCPREELHLQHDEFNCTNQQEEMEVDQDNSSDNTTYVQFPAGGIDDTLVSFGNYLVSLLKRLPLYKSYELQQKFISETMNTTINIEKERFLAERKRKKGANQAVNRGIPPNPSGLGQEHSRANGLSNKSLANKNHSSECQLSSGQKLGQAVHQSKTNTSGEHHALNNLNGISEISVEEGPQITLIKKELETNLDQPVYCNGFTSFESMRTKNGLGRLEAPLEDNSIICYQCPLCKEIFQSSAELRRHRAAKHPDGENEATGREVHPKLPILEGRVLAIGSSSILPGRPDSSLSDRSH